MHVETAQMDTQESVNPGEPEITSRRKAGGESGRKPSFSCIPFLFSLNS